MGTSKKLLEEIIGEPIFGYRAASYSITAQSLWALEILAEEGFRYDSSIFPIRHDHNGLPSHPRFFQQPNGNGGPAIAEIPLSTVRLAGINFPVAGGGYLRILPYVLNHLAISHLNRANLNLQWSFFIRGRSIPNSRRIPGPWLSRFRQYTNLGRLEARFAGSFRGSHLDR